jgi:outer membrane protein
MKKGLLIIPFFCCFLLYAQDELTLQQCLEKAAAFDLQESAEIAQIQKSEVEISYHPWSLLPDLQGSVGLNTYFGRRVDPYTNTFATNQVNSNSLGLTSGVNLFNGLQFFSEKKRLNYIRKTGEINLELKRNERFLKIIDLYTELSSLTIEQSLCSSRIQAYRDIQSLQRLLLEAGKISMLDTLKSHNSLVLEELQLQTIQNSITLKTYQLNFYSGFELTTTHTYNPESFSEVTLIPKPGELFTLQQLENDLLVAQEKFKSDRSAALPSLMLTGSLGTGFSTNNKDYTLPGTPVKPYFDQLSQNLYEGVGLNLQIPLFNKGNLLKSIDLRRISEQENRQQSQLSQLRLKQQKAELEQQLLFMKATEVQQTIVAGNLRTIFEKSVLLYQEGKLSYREVETALIDWQIKQFEVESTIIQHAKLRLLLQSY